MIKRLHKSIILGMVVFFVFSMVSSIAAFADINVPDQSTEFYVNDTAGILSAEEKTEILTTANQFYEKNKQAQIVVVTVNSLEGNDSVSYGRALYNKYGVGKDSMGVLILFSLGSGKGDRDIRIVVGDNMQAYLTDAKSGNLIDTYAMPYFQNEEFGPGLVSLQKATADYITEVLAKESTAGTTTSTDYSIDFSAFFFILGALIFIFGIIILIYRIYKSIENRKAYIASMQKMISEKDKKIKEMKQVFREKETLISKLEQDKKILYTEISQEKAKVIKLQEWKNRTKQLFPNVEDAIEEMKRKEKLEADKKKANEVKNLILKAENIPISKDNVSELEIPVKAYESLTDEQKKYVVGDIVFVRQKYERSCKLLKEHETRVRIENSKKKANEMEKSILTVISGISLMSAMYHLSKLNNLKKEYNNLSDEEKSFVDSSVVEKLNSFISRGERDEEEERRKKAEERRRREEEERRRRNMMSRTSSSFRSGGGFSSGGFRGSSSNGGGAGRRF